MDFAPVYLLQRFLYRAFDFFHHWYVDGSRTIANKFIVTLEAIDQTFAVAITLRHFFEPLYKDYSIIGRIMGVIFRIGRIILGAAVYLLVVVAFTIFYLAWLALPVGLLWYVATGIFN